MITPSEREWLADSEKWNFKRDIYGISCFCPSCKHCEFLTETANGVFCQDAEDMWLYDKLSKCPLIPSKELLLEAAEFEGRVAMWLAKHISFLDCLSCGCDVHRSDCTVCRMKKARLKVEEDMYSE